MILLVCFCLNEQPHENTTPIALRQRAHSTNRIPNPAQFTHTTRPPLLSLEWRRFPAPSECGRTSRLHRCQKWRWFKVTRQKKMYSFLARFQFLRRFHSRIGIAKLRGVHRAHEGACPINDATIGAGVLRHCEQECTTERLAAATKYAGGLSPMRYGDGRGVTFPFFEALCRGWTGVDGAGSGLLGSVIFTLRELCAFKMRPLRVLSSSDVSIVALVCSNSEKSIVTPRKKEV